MQRPMSSVKLNVSWNLWDYVTAKFVIECRRVLVVPTQYVPQTSFYRINVFYKERTLSHPSFILVSSWGIRHCPAKYVQVFYNQKFYKKISLTHNFKNDQQKVLQGFFLSLPTLISNFKSLWSGHTRLTSVVHSFQFLYK